MQTETSIMRVNLLLIFSLLFCTALRAQDANPQQRGLVEEIEVESEGRIIIDIPEDILKEVIQPSDTPSHPKGQGTPGKKREKITNEGYRIQIFADGRNQATLRSRATARTNAVCARFPAYRGQVYTISRSPNLYTRIGNFKTQQEASSALAQLRRAFPAFASEMRVIKCAINPGK